VSEHVSHIQLLPIEMDGGNYAIFVSTDVEDIETLDPIHGIECMAQIGEREECSGFNQPAPRLQRQMGVGI
jgi:hypothetical protein